MEKNKSLLIIFAKVPGLGLAKSRIAATTGKEKAACIYRELLSITASLAPPFPHVISFAGAPTAGPLKSLFPHALSFDPQPDAGLGERLHDAFSRYFSRGYRSICAIGTDCPAISSCDITKAFTELEKGTHAVLGPASDGGYYLIGLDQNALSVFQATQWSQAGLLKETMSILQKEKQSFYLLRELSDIDTYNDYRIWKGEK